jgi:hypothetical protein
VGCGNAIYIASKYDLKEIIPFLMTIFERLKPSIQVEVVVSIDGLPIKEETNMFGVGAPVEESSQTLVIGELFLFQRLAILPSMCANPLV